VVEERIVDVKENQHHAAQLLSEPP
jgi:hypothetical protein